MWMDPEEVRRALAKTSAEAVEEAERIAKEAAEGD
jgi:hypothetical protein